MAPVSYIWGDEREIFDFLDSIEDEDIEEYFAEGKEDVDILEELRDDFEEDEDFDVDKLNTWMIRRWAEVRLGLRWREQPRYFVRKEEVKSIPFSSIEVAEIGRED